MGTEQLKKKVWSLLKRGVLDKKGGGLLKSRKWGKGGRFWAFFELSKGRAESYEGRFTKGWVFCLRKRKGKKG